MYCWYIFLNWVKGWSDIKKPKVSNSFDSFSSKGQSSVFAKMLSFFTSSLLKSSAWFNDLFSKSFLDLSIILGIELNKDAIKKYQVA